MQQLVNFKTQAILKQTFDFQYFKVIEIRIR